MSTKLQFGRLLNDDKIVCVYLYNIGERERWKKGNMEKKEGKHKSQHLRHEFYAKVFIIIVKLDLYKQSWSCLFWTKCFRKPLR